MAWVKFDDRRALHPKLRRAGFAARGLDEAAMCQVSADGTDGFLDDATLETLGVGHREKAVSKLAQVLVEVGRWVRDDDAGGYHILGYLDHNPSKQEWEQLRKSRSEAGKVGGARSGASRRSKANAQPSDEASASPDVSPEVEANPQPVPSRPETDSPPDPPPSGGNPRALGTNPRAIAAEAIAATHAAGITEQRQRDLVAFGRHWRRVDVDEQFVALKAAEAFPDSIADQAQAVRLWKALTHQEVSHA